MQGGWWVAAAARSPATALPGCVRAADLILPPRPRSADPASAYFYRGGWNPAALGALVAGAAPTLPGLAHSLCGAPVPALFVHLYSAAWFVGFFVAGAAYVLLMRLQQGSTAAAPAPA